MSTILFILIIGDLVKELKDPGINGIQVANDDLIFLLFYADGMANVGDTVRGLQAHINVISNICERTGMKLNLKKQKY